MQAKISDLKEENKKVFLEAYDRLNTGQKQAVDAIEGPVMVIAGPGTGNTKHRKDGESSFGSEHEKILYFG